MSNGIIIKRIDGHITAAGPAHHIRAALNGAAPITLVNGKVAGDIIWLKPRTDLAWGDDGATANTSHIADTVQHPVHGEILAAWIDMDRLDDAPALVAINHARKVKVAAGIAEQRATDRRAIPACDNCGDCPRCC